jgi:hypothetical protein
LEPRKRNENVSLYITFLTERYIGIVIVIHLGLNYLKNR